MSTEREKFTEEELEKDHFSRIHYYSHKHR